MKALIKVGYACNEHCSFCHTQDVRHIQGDADAITAKIERAAALGHSMVVLSGGEATIRPELVGWARRVAALGMDFGLVTNGLMLAYDEVLEQLVQHRLRYVYMSLHGGEARIHDRLVRRPSFTAARKALDNLSGRGLDLTINCVVTRHNVDHLIGLVDEVAEISDATLKFSAVEPKGGAWHLFQQLVPPISEAAARVVEAISHGRSTYGERGPRYSHGGFPLCLLPGLEDLYDDLKTHGYRTMIEVTEGDFFPVDDRNKVLPDPICRDCRLRGPCPGLYAAYHARHGADELRPVLGGVRSNSFDWVFETLVYEGHDPAAGCPLAADGVTPWDRGRSLFVRNEGKIGRFMADTRDFGDDEIEAIKHVAGQVYLDASRKPAPDDFAADLVELRRIDECRACPEYAHCTGMYEPVYEPVFERDDAKLTGLLERIEGDVLDIGCGEGRYLSALSAARNDAAVRYHGLDPDPEAVRRLSERWPSVRVEVGEAEDLQGEGRFDHVLILRSWNHLRDPDRVLGAIAKLLRPGGSLIVVDNVAFGLARTRRQAQRAHQGGAGFEHHRNDDAQRAHERIARLGFRLVQRWDVGPESSNQWLLQYRSDTL